MPASTINASGDNVADQNQPGGKRRGPFRFAHASGSQPLDGYTIKRGVGVGGFGEVYYATSEAGKEVALKRIQRNLDVELRGVSQCLNLKHPNLVGLYDIRYDGEGQAWVIMEYISGESLQDVVERNPNGMPYDEVRRWFKGILDGVAYLHDRGIVHRDLKPGNIFIDEDIVKIGDYGLSKFISCSRRSGQTESVGTFHYMAPEIGLGRYGKEIDIYALGILLYEMLTGRVPYEGESSQEIIMKHLTAEPDLSMLPVPYRNVVAKALTKDPEMRYRSVDDMARALGLDGQGTELPPPARNESPVVAQVVADPPIPEEPVARALKDLVAHLKYKWTSSRMSTPGKLVLTALFIGVVLSMGIPLFQLAIAGGTAYAIYYVVWYLIHAGNKKTVNARSMQPPPIPRTVSQPATPVFVANAASAQKPLRRSPHRSITRSQLHDALRASLAEKSFDQRAKELTGSMLMAAIVSIVLGIFATLIGDMDYSAYEWGPVYAWVTISSVLASWFILLLGKFWETSTGDQALRRFSMLSAGLGIGLISYLLANALLINPNYILNDLFGIHPGFYQRFPSLYTVDGSPRILAYLAYFGGLFAGLRWWLHADPLRSTRFSILATAVAVVGAILMHGIMPIPRGFLVGGVTAIAVQLSAPWVDARQRKAQKSRLEEMQQTIVV
jgi:serine/threonine protein kinase